ncbi:hypothetical protein KM043_001980 [Ampulex compressa]|nr:hypothetical protein KM043_001980 [Ampulex compressa]
MSRKVVPCTLLCVLSLFTYLHREAMAVGPSKECLDLDVEDLEGYLGKLDLSAAPTLEVMAGGFKCSVTSLPFGALKSDWARLILLRDAQPESSILREKLGRLLRILVIAYNQREERFEIPRNPGSSSGGERISNSFPSSTEFGDARAEPATASDISVDISGSGLFYTAEEKSDESDMERTAPPAGEYFVTRKDEPGTLMTYDVESEKKWRSDIGVKIDATPFSFDTKGTSYYFTSSKMDDEGGKTGFPPASDGNAINSETVGYSELDDGQKSGLVLNNVTLDGGTTEVPSTFIKDYRSKTSVPLNIAETRLSTEEYSTEKSSITTESSESLSAGTSSTSNERRLTASDLESSTKSRFSATTLASVDATSKMEGSTSILNLFETSRFTSEVYDSTFSDELENKGEGVTNPAISKEETTSIFVTPSNEGNTSETNSVMMDVNSTTWSPFRMKDSTLPEDITTIGSTYFFKDTASRNDTSATNSTNLRATKKYVVKNNKTIIRNYPDPSMKNRFRIIKYYNSSNIIAKGNWLYYKPSYESTKLPAMDRDFLKIPLSATVNPQPAFDPRKTIVAFEGISPQSRKRGSPNADTEQLFRWFYKLDSDYSKDTNYRDSFQRQPET